MKFTFGICTTEGQEQKIANFINSIQKNSIPQENYEIVIVGNIKKEYFKNDNIKIILFDENLKNGWITKKKNLIADHAKFNNIVFLHDYLILEENWYQSMCEFGNDWQVLLTKVFNYEGQRFRDWTLLGNGRKNSKQIKIKNQEINCNPYNPFIEVHEPNSNALLPYDEKRFNNWIYINGSYWIAKKDFMIENPLNEDLCWGESEDIEWSIRIREKTKVQINANTSVIINKPGKIPIYSECCEKYLNDMYFKIFNYYGTLPNQDVSLEASFSEQLKKIL
jgi:hypothetical protein